MDDRNEPSPSKAAIRVMAEEGAMIHMLSWTAVCGMLSGAADRIEALEAENARLRGQLLAAGDEIEALSDASRARPFWNLSGD